MGAEEGLRLDLRTARPVNSFDAHRLVRMGAAHGRGEEILERLLHAHHSEGLDIGAVEVLEKLGGEAGTCSR
ncbi:thioredoxin domain-containing protein [Microbacterium resistens]|uniref:hypothetical protein n=1 Tax=Microbacterium resistens TaxID=156977 RepID=UPI003908B2AB